MGAKSRRISVPSGARTRKPAARTAAKSRPPARRPASAARPAAPKARPRPKPIAASKSKSTAKAPAKPATAPKGKAAPAPAEPAVPVALRPGDPRRHVMSLSFLRDGDEFLARMETDTGQITELKNRSLDQLLTLVASELEDILE